MDQRRSGLISMSAMSATPWLSARQAPASRCCSPFLALQWRRFAGSKVFVFDKGGSARAALLGMGGDAIDLGGNGVAAFQPLARIDTPQGRADALNWVMTLLGAGGSADTPEVKEPVWSALGSLMLGARLNSVTSPACGFWCRTPPSGSAPAYTQDGAMGGCSTAPKTASRSPTLSCSRWKRSWRGRRRRRPPCSICSTGWKSVRWQPHLLVLDEAWLFLDSPIFAARIREWLKTLRKKNVAVVFATQSLADIATSSIAPALIESCSTRIYLPNERAFEPQQRQAYERFGLNETEIDLIATAQRKRHYYYASPKGRRLFELALGPVALAFCTASDPDARATIAALERQPRNTVLAQVPARAPARLGARRTRCARTQPATSSNTAHWRLSDVPA
jgi:type IV secretion system protein VirB4